MEKRIEITEVPDEFLELIAGGVLSAGDKDQMNRYINWFKGRGYNLSETQGYWVEHMNKNHITSYTEEEAREYIASIW
ncbi:MAG: hypothetical protein IJ781_11760 [Atopobiaceae bacterium]|nr:hypothetical protein [Atopobiaceae bacterium]